MSLGPNSTTRISCGLVVQLVLQHVVQQIYNTLKQMSFGLDTRREVETN